MLSARKGLGVAAQYLPHVAFTCCCLIAALAFVDAKVFWEPWLPTLWPQALILFLVVAVLATGVATAAHVFRLNLELLIAALAIAMMTAFCGPAATAVVLYFLVSAACVTRLLLYPFRDLDDVPLNLQIVFGWAVYGIFFTVIARARMHVPAVHAVILAMPIVVVAAIPVLRRETWLRVRRSLVPSAESRGRPWLYVVGLTACVVILSFHLAEVALPERYWDALVMHLYVPSYVSAHRAWSYDVKNYAFAYMPMTVDFLYTHMFLLEGEQAARLLNFVALLMTCVAVFQLGVRSGSRTAAIWSVVLLASMPVALIESTSLFVEHSVALFIASAALAIVVAGFRVSLLVHTTVMCLLAAATASKLHGAIGALILGTTTALLYLRYRRGLREYVTFTLVTASTAILALWPYILSWRKTGNPVFPFMNLIFKSPYFRLENFEDARWIGNLSPRMLLDATFHTSRFAECGDGALGFGLFVFLPAGIVAAIYQRNKTALFSIGIGLLAIIVVCLPSQYLRYMYIFMPLLMVGVALGIDALGREGRFRLPVVAAAIAVAALNITRFPSGGWAIGASDFRAVFDSGARRTLVLEQVPEVIANQVINGLAGPDARVMYFANSFGAHLTGTAIYDNWYNTSHELDLANIASEQDVRAVLRQINPTYAIFDPNKLQDPIVGKRYAVIADYLQHNATLVTEVGRLLLYQTSSTGE